MNKQTRLLIFDWDGTLVNSIDRIVASLQVAADKCGIQPPTDAQAKAIIGLSLVEAFPVLYPHINDDDISASFRQAYVDNYFLLEQQPSPFYPGVRDSLDNFKAAGYQLAVATGKSRRGLDHMLRNHNMLDFFHITRCADETKSKPNPLMLNEILHNLRQQPEHAIMVGDSPYDLQMANHARVPGVAVSYGAQPLEILLAEQPALSIDKFSELGDWLAQDHRI